jgi:hypothetical protein
MAAASADLMRADRNRHFGRLGKRFLNARQKIDLTS